MQLFYHYVPAQQTNYINFSNAYTKKESMEIIQP